MTPTFSIKLYPDIFVLNVRVVSCSRNVSRTEYKSETIRNFRNNGNIRFFGPNPKVSIWSTCFISIKTYNPSKCLWRGSEYRYCWNSTRGRFRTRLPLPRGIGIETDQDLSNSDSLQYPKHKDRPTCATCGHAAKWWSEMSVKVENLDVDGVACQHDANIFNQTVSRHICFECPRGFMFQECFENGI